MFLGERAEMSLTKISVPSKAASGNTAISAKLWGFGLPAFFFAPVRTVDNFQATIPCFFATPATVTLDLTSPSQS